MKSETIEKALDAFRQHDIILRTSKAIQLGIAPRTLYALYDAGLLVKISDCSGSHGYEIGQERRFSKSQAQSG